MRDHKLDNVIDSAISHINKKMKTNEYDHAVRETVLVSYSCIILSQCFEYCVHYEVM
jgi:hypothetical protein